MFTWRFGNNIITWLWSSEDNQIPIKNNQTSSIASYFKISHILHSVAHHSFFWQLIYRGRYVPKPKTTWFKCVVVLIPTWTHDVSSWHNSSPHNIVCRCCSFALVVSVPKASGFILKFYINNKNSSSFELLNKAI